MAVVICGVPIEFPYEPYPCQVAYMEAVIQCLNGSCNGVLESPTGTGKTLCLLCACLGWIRWSQSQTVQVDSASAPGSGAPVPLGSVPKVIYTSRTHSQLSQVVRELNKTVYRHSLKISLLGSRDLLCVHPQVSLENNSNTKNAMCRAKVRTHTCSFYNNFERMTSSAALNPTSTVEDIEDLVKSSKAAGVCPYYKSRETQKTADLILAPYSYLLDPKTRKANQIEVRDNIIIFDEAHNLAQVCEDVASSSLSSKEVAQCIKEANDVLNDLSKKEEEFRKAKDETLVSFAEVDKEQRVELSKDIDKNDLSHLILLLHNLQTQLEGLVPQLRATEYGAPCSLRGLEKPGAFMFDLLNKSGISPRFRDPVIELIDKITLNYFSDGRHSSPFHSSGSALEKFSSFLATVFPSLDATSEGDHNCATKDSKYFKVLVDDDGVFNELVVRKDKRPSLLINYWCFSASPAMSFLRSGVKSVLVTSGTLTPVNGFVKELSIPFQVILVNGHVVSKEQTWVGVVSKGPDGTPLNGIFCNRLSDKYLNALGMTIFNVVRHAPHGGILVFFASYSHLNGCVKAWQESGVWAKISSMKAIISEPKAKDQFQLAWKEFQTKADDPTNGGAVLLAVCRGKVSEGIDFADTHGRAVIIVGMPFPPLLNPRVILKKSFLLENRNLGMSPDNWYNLEAARAVCQAIGRVIRHKNDFGAVILADQRFGSWQSTFFPSWMTVNICENFGDLIKSLVRFYRNCSHLDGQRPILSSTAGSESKRSAGRSEWMTTVAKQPEIPCCSQLGAVEWQQQYGSEDSGNVRSSSDVLTDRSSLLERLEETQEKQNHYQASSGSGRSAYVGNSDESILSSSTQTPSTAVPEPKRKRIKLAIGAGVSHAPRKPGGDQSSILVYIQQVRATLTDHCYGQFTSAVSSYKTNEKIDDLLSTLLKIFSPNQRDVMAGFQRFLLPQHRRQFLDQCAIHRGD